ncbi:hypothetical protein TGMAS_214220, partial [Toxoplasma gondii MAS]
REEAASEAERRENGEEKRKKERWRETRRFQEKGRHGEKNEDRACNGFDKSGGRPGGEGGRGQQRTTEKLSSCELQRQKEERRETAHLQATETWLRRGKKEEGEKRKDTATKQFRRSENDDKRASRKARFSRGRNPRKRPLPNPSTRKSHLSVGNCSRRMRQSGVQPSVSSLSKVPRCFTPHAQRSYFPARRDSQVVTASIEPFPARPLDQHGESPPESSPPHLLARRRNGHDTTPGSCACQVPTSPGRGSRVPELARHCAKRLDPRADHELRGQFSYRQGTPGACNQVSEGNWQTPCGCEVHDDEDGVNGCRGSYGRLRERHVGCTQPERQTVQVRYASFPPKEFRRSSDTRVQAPFLLPNSRSMLELRLV